MIIMFIKVAVQRCMHNINLYQFSRALYLFQSEKRLLPIAGSHRASASIFNLVASWPGSAHDSRIFDNSSARVQYERGTVPGILLGDKGYPCRSYLMTPFRDTGTKDSPKHR